jgi:hypothetical protein
MNRGRSGRPKVVGYYEFFWIVAVRAHALWSALVPFELKWFFFGEYLICLNATDANLSIFSIVIAEQPKGAAPTVTGSPGPGIAGALLLAQR